MNQQESFVHILLFRCPQCSNPVAAAISTEERNLEQTDGRAFAVRCSCGWNGHREGTDAKRHWVEPWE